MIRPLRIYLADLTYTTLSLATEAFPLNIGFVGAFCQQAFGRRVEVSLYKYIDHLEEAIRLQPPDILGMSNYPWNFNLGLAFFQWLEEFSPETIRVMGGPNIPLVDKERNDFILENPVIDFYTYLEEQAFSNVVMRAIEMGLDKPRMRELLLRSDSSFIARGGL